MASKRRLRRNACTGKIRYKTPKDAQGHLSWLKKTERKRFFGYDANVYLCPFCHGYHVGRRVPTQDMRHGAHKRR